MTLVAEEETSLRLFIGGISQETTELQLKNYFESFGPISSYAILYDKVTKVSKGYGFINCESKKTYNRILASKPHMINGRILEVNKALQRNGNVPEDIKSKGFRKLFIGGLGKTITKDDLFEYFSQFGPLVNAYVIMMPGTEISKGFGYVEFSSVDVANMVLNMKKHFIKQKKITVENHRQSFQNTLNMIQPQENPQIATQETAFSVPPFSTRDNPQETPPTCESDGYYWDNAGLSLFSYAAHGGAVSSEVLPGDPYAMYCHGNQDWSQDASAFNCFGSRFTYTAEQSSAQILTEVGVQTVPANTRSGTQKAKYLRDQESQEDYSHTSFQTPFLPHQYFTPEQPIITSSTLETRSPTNLTDVSLRDRHSSEQLAVRSSALLSESHASLQHESCVSPATTYLPGRILPRFGEQFSTNKTGYPGLVPSNLEHLPHSSIHSKGLSPSTRQIPLTSKQHDVTPGKGLYSGEDCSSTSERKRAIFKAALNGDPENYRFNQRRR